MKTKIDSVVSRMAAKYHLDEEAIKADLRTHTNLRQVAVGSNMYSLLMFIIDDFQPKPEGNPDMYENRHALIYDIDGEDFNLYGLIQFKSEAELFANTITIKTSDKFVYIRYTYNG